MGASIFSNIYCKFFGALFEKYPILQALAQNRLRLIENSVVGDPKIECEPDKILIAVQTQNTFKGNIYVKGYFRSPECKSDHREHASGAYLQVKLNECGMIRTQQVLTFCD
jgi:hypothetical protein